MWGGLIIIIALDDAISCYIVHHSSVYAHTELEYWDTQNYSIVPANFNKHKIDNHNNIIIKECYSRDN